MIGFRELQSLNDVLGHSIADDVLKAITERLSAHTRVEDFLCRWRGNSFLILTRTCQDVESIEIFLKRLLLVLKRPYFVGHNPIYLQGFAGALLYPQDGDNMELLLNRVGIAYTEIKDSASRSLCFYDNTLSSDHLERIQLEHELHQALEKKQFELRYQPLISVAEGRIAGVEALLRWRHPKKGLMAPGAFIGILETTGLIIPVGEWIIRTACQHFQQWQDLVDNTFRISINLSPRQFQAPDLLASIVRILEDCQVPTHRLELEITENIAMQNVTATQSLLDAIKAKGICLSMDDFGTGYSSLAYLKTFPFDTLKIDRAFTQNIVNRQEKCAIIQAMILLGQGFDLRIIAEGIQTPEQARRLFELGCQEMQGYWFSRPLAPEQITEFLTENNSQQFALG